MERAAELVEVPMFTFRAKRPNGEEVLIYESWEFVDTSLRLSGTSWVPAGGKRRKLATGEAVRFIEDGVFRSAATNEILTAF